MKYLTAITLALSILRLLGIIKWSWWLVFVTLYVPALGLIAFFVWALWYLDKNKDIYK